MERSKKYWQTDNNKVIQWENAHIGDIKGTSQRLMNNKEGYQKYKELKN